MSDIKLFCIGADEGGRASVLISILDALMRKNKPHLEKDVRMSLRCLIPGDHSTSGGLVSAMARFEYHFLELQASKITQNELKSADIVVGADAGVTESVRNQFHIKPRTLLTTAVNFAPAWKDFKVPPAKSMNSEDCDRFIRMTEMASMGILNTLQMKARSIAVSREWG